MTATDTRYTISTVVDDSYEDAIERVTEALKEEGFGVLTTIDVKATLKQKIDVDVEPYIILGACNPPLAHRGMQAEPELGALLPCNVLVRQVGDTVHVAAMEPMVALGLIENDELTPVAEEAAARLRRVIESL